LKPQVLGAAALQACAQQTPERQLRPPGQSLSLPQVSSAGPVMGTSSRGILHADSAASEPSKNQRVFMSASYSSPAATTAAPLRVGARPTLCGACGKRR
jgi:hypothetical protein